METPASGGGASRAAREEGRAVRDGRGRGCRRGRAAKLREESRVAAPEQADVGDAVQRHGEPLDAHAERPADAVRRQAAVGEDGRPDLAAAQQLERYLNTLGTIASSAPLLGLLGTVIGLLDSFTGLASANGVATHADVARGVYQSLITSALGLVVAVPSMIFYRHFRGKVDTLLVEMEMQASKLVEIIHGERQA